MKKNSNISKHNTSIIKIILSSSDSKLLQRYCAINKLGEKTAIRKILHIYLSENLVKIDEEADNQLELFQSFQRNIFDKE